MRVSRHSLRRLGTLPAPTYVVGIDERGETGYLLSANGELTKGIGSVPTAHRIDRKRREQLWREVYEYWRSRSMTGFRSAFRDPEWRS